MKIEFNYLADKPELIPICADWAFSAWGKYNPAVTTQKRIESFQKHCNKESVPLTIIAMDGDKPIGMASLRENDGIRQDLSPWLGSLYVDEESRNQGLGEQLIREINRKAAGLGFKEIYLLTYEESLPNWYGSLGWQEIGKEVLAGNPVKSRLNIFEHRQISKTSINSQIRFELFPRWCTSKIVIFSCKL